MSHVRHVHIDALPTAARDRFAACTRHRADLAPALEHHEGGGVRGALAITFALAGGFVLYHLATAGFGRLDGPAPFLAPHHIATCALALAAVLIPAAWVVRQELTARRVPHRPGRYVLGAYLVDARGACLRIEPIAATRRTVRHRAVAGRYLWTEIVFDSSDGQRARFTLHDRPRAVHAIDAVERAVAAAAQAAINADADDLRGADPLYDARDALDARDAAPPAIAPPRGLGPRLTTAVARHAYALAAVTTLGLAPGAWAVRNRLSDEVMYDAAARPAELRAYLARGRVHRAAARARLHRMTLDAAVAARSVSSLRAWLHEFPDAPAPLRGEATAHVHALFADAVATFRRGAGDRDPRAVAFVEGLLAYQEAHGSPPLTLRFRPPQIENLDAIDALLATEAKASKGQYDFAPVAPQLTESTAGPREAIIVDALGDGFGQVFPNDMLDLAHGPRLAGDAAMPADAASVEVAYAVAAMRDDDDAPVFYYEGEGDQPPRTEDGHLRGHLLIGVDVAFTVTMRLPGVAPYVTTLQVRPPDTFSVEPGADDAELYRVMLDHAFDELRTKLGAAFFAVPAADPAAPVPAAAR